MTAKQQIFWTIVAAIFAAILGSIFTAWYSRPASKSDGIIYFWTTTRTVQDALCGQSDTARQCTLVAIDFKNPESDDSGAFRATVDFKIIGDEKPTIKSNVSVGYSFVSSDIVLKRTAPLQDTLEFRRFPQWSTATYTAYVPGIFDGAPRVIVEGVSHRTLNDGDSEDATLSYFWAFIAGLAVLPLLGLIIGFFTWLNKREGGSESDVAP